MTADHRFNCLAGHIDVRKFGRRGNVAPLVLAARLTGSGSKLEDFSMTF